MKPDHDFTITRAAGGGGRRARAAGPRRCAAGRGTRADTARTQTGPSRTRTRPCPTHRTTRLSLVMFSILDVRYDVQRQLSTARSTIVNNTPAARSGAARGVGRRRRATGPSRPPERAPHELHRAKCASPAAHLSSSFPYPRFRSLIPSASETIIIICFRSAPIESWRSRVRPRSRHLSAITSCVLPELSNTLLHATVVGRLRRRPRLRALLLQPLAPPLRLEAARERRGVARRALRRCRVAYRHVRRGGEWRRA